MYLFKKNLLPKSKKCENKRMKTTSPLAFRMIQIFKRNIALSIFSLFNLKSIKNSVEIKCLPLKIMCAIKVMRFCPTKMCIRN